MQHIQLTQHDVIAFALQEYLLNRSVSDYWQLHAEFIRTIPDELIRAVVFEVRHHFVKPSWTLSSLTIQLYCAEQFLIYWKNNIGNDDDR